VYNRYIPQDSRCTPVEGTEHTVPAREKPGRQSLSALLKKLRLDRLDSGDILLLLVAALLWKESEDTDLLLALGAAMLLGDGEE